MTQTLQHSVLTPHLCGQDDQEKDICLEFLRQRIAEERKMSISMD